MEEGNSGVQDSADNSRASIFSSITPAVPPRFPLELEALIEIWGVDRCAISWPAWPVPEFYDRGRLSRRFWLNPEQHLGGDALQPQGPAWTTPEASA
jgi:hypothetical protein